MSLEIWLLYLTTLFIFMVTPGPSHFLMLSNAMAHGFRPSLATAAGDLTANSLQLLAAGLGLAAVLAASQYALTIVKWAGATYLLWLGIRMLLRANRAGVGAPAAPSVRALWFQGFLTSASNPKAVVFFAALLPQFIDPAGPFALQFLILAVTYLIVDGTFLTTYGATAGWIRQRLKTPAHALLDRIAGTFMIGAAILLGLKTLRDARAAA